MATGSHMSNSFGFRDSKGFQPFLSGLKGYRNVYAAQAFEPVGEPVVQTALRRRGPLAEKRSEYYIYPSSFNTAEYPSVLDIPVSAPRRRLVEVRMAAEMRASTTATGSSKALRAVPVKRTGTSVRRMRPCCSGVDVPGFVSGFPHKLLNGADGLCVTYVPSAPFFSVRESPHLNLGTGGGSPAYLPLAA